MASHLLRSVLSPAVRLWLQSQVEAVGKLELTIESSDRQLLSGKIPQVTIAAEGVVYQALHLSQLALEGRDIAVNLPQVLRGKPLQLLAPIAVMAEVSLREADLNASLSSSLLAPVWLEWQRQLTDRLRSDLAESGGWAIDAPLRWSLPQISITAGAITLCARVALAQSQQEPTIAVVLTAPLQLEDGQILVLVEPRWSIGDRSGLFEALRLDLGETVAIDRLELLEQNVVCHGQIWVQP